VITAEEVKGPKHIRLLRAERGAAVLMTLAAIALHVVNAVSAGALWRDEVNTVGLATLPSFRDVWQNLQFDSFPILWLVAVRFLSATFGSMNDSAFRAAGLVVGLFLLAAVWISARFIGRQVPLVALAIFALSPAVIRWGDSLRAYGAGMTAAILICTTMWRFAQLGTRPSFAVALLASLAGVQTLYYNATVVLATCAGAAAVCVAERAWRRLKGVAAIGVISAASLAPYAGTIGRGTWNSLVTIPEFTVGWFLVKLGETLDPAGPWALPLWLAAVVVALYASVRETTFRKNAPSAYARRVVLFAATTLLVGVVSHFGFLKALSYLTQPWYYLTLLALTATCIEAISASLATTVPARITRLCVAVAVAAATTMSAFSHVRSRMTNVDAIAAELRSAARHDDLILLNPWYLGVSFGRYSEGPATWRMVPDVGFDRFHRFDRIAPLMLEANTAAPVTPIITEAERVLRAGGTVYFAGDLPSSAEPAISLAPANLPQDGWNCLSTRRNGQPISLDFWPTMPPNSKLFPSQTPRRSALSNTSD
jgi:hypothetical protein